MGVALNRIDDRLIHGQVVVGWGQPLDVRFIVLVDDNVAASDWEQDLYRMGVPPEMELRFADVETASAKYTDYASDPRPGILLTGDIDTMYRLIKGGAAIREVNVGGLHYRAGRAGRLRYVFLTPEEETGLRRLAGLGVKVSAQDVPTARPVPIDELLGDKNHPAEPSR
jgi:PTS system mannose-specific IIB component/fructoselysine and glucoselysine-specific PTS system IIB component